MILILHHCLYFWLCIYNTNMCCPTSWQNNQLIRKHFRLTFHIVSSDKLFLRHWGVYNIGEAINCFMGWLTGYVEGGGCFFQSKTKSVFFSNSFSLICKGLHQTQLQFNETNTCTSQVYSINYKTQTTENTFIYDIEGEIYSYFWEHAYSTKRTQLF